MKEKDKLQELKKYLNDKRQPLFFTSLSGKPYLFIIKNAKTISFEFLELLEKRSVSSIQKHPDYHTHFDLSDKSHEAVILNYLAKSDLDYRLIYGVKHLKIPISKKLQILWGKYREGLTIDDKLSLLFTIYDIENDNERVITKLLNMRDKSEIPNFWRYRLNSLFQSKEIIEKVDNVEKSIKSIRDSAEGSSEVFVTKEIVPKLSILEKQIIEIKDSLDDYKDIPQQFENLESFTKQSFKDLKAWRESQNVYLSDERKEDIKELVSITNTRIDDINTTMDRDKRTMQIWLGILTALVTILLAFVAIVLPLLLNNLSNRIEESITIIWFLTQILFN